MLHAYSPPPPFSDNSFIQSKLQLMEGTWRVHRGFMKGSIQISPELFVSRHELCIYLFIPSSSWSSNVSPAFWFLQVYNICSSVLWYSFNMTSPAKSVLFLVSSHKLITKFRFHVWLPFSFSYWPLVDRSKWRHGCVPVFVRHEKPVTL